MKAPTKFSRRDKTTLQRVAVGVLAALIVGSVTIIGCQKYEDAKALALAKEYGHVRKSLRNAVDVNISTRKGANELIPYLYRLRDLRFVSVIEVKLTAEHLKAIGALENLKKLTLRNCEVNDDDLEHLSALTNLTQLHLQGNPIQGSGLRHLANLGQLWHLDMPLTQIEGPGLEHLRGLPKLRELNLTRTKLNDHGLVYLLQLQQVEKLGINDTEVTSDGMMQLADLHSLRHVSLPSDLPEPTRENMEHFRKEKQAFMKRFNEAHVASKQIARGAGEIVPEDRASPFNFAVHEMR